MRSRLPASLMAVLLSMAAASAANAQTHRLHLGPRVSYNFDAEVLGLGGQLSVPVARHLEFYPSVDYYFVDVGNLLAINADLKYRLSTENVNWLYLGGGLSIARASAGGASATDAGLNLFAGAESLRGNIHPFGELRLTIGDGSSAQVAFGLNFTLGRNVR